MAGRTSLAFLSIMAAAGLAGCASAYVVRLETASVAKLDLSEFQRVYVAGFLFGGSPEVDGNLETVQLMQNALRTQSPFHVVEADAQPLMSLAEQRPPGDSTGGRPQPPKLQSETDFRRYDHIFTDADY